MTKFDIMRHENMTKQNNTESEITENDGAGDDDYDDVEDDNDDNNNDNEAEVAKALVYLGSATN